MPLCSFSNTTWNSSINTWVRLPFFQLSVTRLRIVSVITRSPVGFNWSPKLWISKTTIRLSRSTVLSCPKISSDPVVNSSKDRAISFAFSSGCSSSLFRRSQRVAVLPVASASWYTRAVQRSIMDFCCGPTPVLSICSTRDIMNCDFSTMGLFSP